MTIKDNQRLSKRLSKRLPKKTIENTIKKTTKKTIEKTIKKTIENIHSGIQQFWPIQCQSECRCNNSPPINSDASKPKLRRDTSLLNARQCQNDTLAEERFIKRLHNGQTLIYGEA